MSFLRNIDRSCEIEHEGNKTCYASVTKSLNGRIQYEQEEQTIHYTDDSECCSQHGCSERRHGQHDGNLRGGSPGKTAEGGWKKREINRCYSHEIISIIGIAVLVAVVVIAH